MIEVEPVAGALGAEIRGADLSRPLTDGTLTDLREAYLEHLVLFFRDQRLTPDRHKALGRCFGELYVYPDYEPGAARLAAIEGDPEIIELRKEPGDRANIGHRWHSDLSFEPSPPLGSILYALEVPRYGGDTLFANQYLAYDALSGGMKALLGGLEAVHDDVHVIHPGLDPAQLLGAGLDAGAIPAAKGNGSRPLTASSHPVIRTHPETKRKALYVNLSYTRRFSGMTVEESRPLLEYLFAHSARPDFTCRFRWRRHSLAFWDNRCALHFALNDYQGQRRVMQRVTIKGDRPV